jgi:glutamate-1-semialdehyde 2,1-aminomutase
MFGKAMGNGYAITAVLGRRSVMDAAQTSFISSTFWTERIGPTAAIKTLEIMEQERSWEVISEKGLILRKGIQSLATDHNLEIELFGIPALTGFNFISKYSLEYKTYITQEMLKKGILSANSTYLAITHTPEIFEKYFEILHPIFKDIKDCEEGRDIYDLLETSVCHSGFKRLN